MSDQKQSGMFPLKGKLLKFQKKEFKTIQNFTVRLGADYAERKALSVGDLVSLTDADGEEFYCEARVTHITSCMLLNVTPGVLKNNSNSHMRDGIGLVLGLQNYYKRQLHGTDMVTCIGFVPQVGGKA